MVGQVLGNRYELIEKIGGGGMACVYKAKDRLLGRYVAVKILRPEFINDEEFVKRFIVEAQAAASLSHPNIVSIYDVGHEDGIHYMVMEYIDGITLKDYICHNGPLNWRDAVNIAIQVCSAIEQAHKNHIVHRDIKPHNILLTRDGIAKVTDFGIARAVSSSTITMAGTTIGSVHYFSPEQARGGYIDEKSDLYSLGVALYEMVTGRVPFDGETPIAIALKHIQDQPVQPVMFRKSIPSGVNDIVMKAMRKEQSQRYQTAADMLSDLYRVLKEPNGEFADFDDDVNYPTKKIYTIDPEDYIEEEGNNHMDPRARKKKERRKDRYTVPLAVLTSILIMLAVGYITYKVIFPTIMPNFTVDNYVGRDIEEVRAELESANIQVKEKPVFSDSIKKGTIIKQSIEPGQELREGGYNVIEFEVSKGPELVKIPDFKMQDYRTVEAELETMKLVPDVQEEFSDSVGNGLVTRTEPEAGSEVKPGSKVIVYKSKGPELKQVKVPNLIGKTRPEAQQILADSGLAVGKIDPESSSVVDKIIKQYPEADTLVDEGTAVDIFLESDGSATNSGDGSEETTQISNRKLVRGTIILDKQDEYGNTIEVRVEITPSDTNKPEIIMNEKKSKKSFPLTVIIPVPENGTTHIKIYLDNKFYTQYYVTG